VSRRTDNGATLGEVVDLEVLHATLLHLTLEAVEREILPAVSHHLALRTIQAHLVRAVVEVTVQVAEDMVRTGTDTSRPQCTHNHFNISRRRLCNFSQQKQPRTSVIMDPAFLFYNDHTAHTTTFFTLPHTTCNFETRMSGCLFVSSGCFADLHTACTFGALEIMSAFGHG
jgi:hypothetical protein